MNKRALILVALAACLTIGLAPAFAGIAASKHDFTVTGNQMKDISGGEICKPCHVPHNAAPGGSTAPLWNHLLSTQTFTMYGATVAGTTPDLTPNSKSLLCLSCHDGVTKMDAFGGDPGTTVMTGTASVGIDLSKDHPISIGITAGSKGIKSSIGSNVKIFDDKVECASCHDIHNTAGVGKLLRVSNASSALCLECHDK